MIWKELEWEKRRIDNINNKIKTFIAFEDYETKEKVINSVKKVEYAEIVGIAESGKDTLKQIIKLRPDMVFMEYNYQGETGFDIIKKLNKELEMDIPIFNMIGDNIPTEERNEVLKLIGSRMNCIIGKEELYETEVQDILKEYKEYDFK